jgi:hypothetical protein
MNYDTSYKLRVTSYELQATSYKLRATSFERQVMSYELRSVPRKIPPAPADDNTVWYIDGVQLSRLICAG